MIEKITELKNLTNSKKVKEVCEGAISAISSAIYNGVTSEAKIEIEKVAITNLFEELSKHKDVEGVKEWLANQKRLFTIQNLGVRDAVNSLNETEDLKQVLESFKDALNQGVHEARLYEQFITALSPFGYFPTVGNAIKSIEDRVNLYKTDVDILKILETMKDTRSNYLVPLIEDVVNNYLSNKNKQTKYQLSETLMKFTYDPFVRDIASLLTLDATELQLEYANAQCDIEKVYSPVLYLRENEAIFSVNKVYYIKKGNNVTRLPQVEVLQLDEEFKSLCETLNNPNIVVEKEGITVYFGNDKAFITEDSLVINDKEINNEEFKNSVEVSELAGNRGFYSLIEFLKSNINEIAEVDFVKRVYLKEDENRSADVFKLRDNVFITTHNPEMGKSTFYRNVNPIQARNIMMEHLRYDISSLVEGLLPNEEKINAQIKDTKDSYNSYIIDLEKRITEFKLNSFGEDVNEQVIEALEEELKDVRDEYKDYLNHIEKYQRGEGINEEIEIDITVDGKHYKIPIPQENGEEKEKEEVEAGTEVGREDIQDEPASAITFDEDDTELLGDTPTIPEDEIDLGVEGAEEEAEEAEEEEEEREAEEEEAELKADTEEEGDEIKIEDEVDIKDEDKEENKEKDKEKDRKKKKEKLESGEGEGLKKTKFVKEAGEKDEEPKKRKRVYLKKKVTESRKPSLKKLLLEQLTDEEAEGAKKIEGADAFNTYYRLRDGRVVQVPPSGPFKILTDEEFQQLNVAGQGQPVNITDEEAEGAEFVRTDDAFNNIYRLRDGRTVSVAPGGIISLNENFKKKSNKLNELSPLNDLKIGDKVTPKDEPELASKIVRIRKDAAGDDIFILANRCQYTRRELKESNIKKKSNKLNEFSPNDLRKGDKVTPKDHPELASEIVNITRDLAGNTIFVLANGTRYTRRELQKSINEEQQEWNGGIPPNYSQQTQTNPQIGDNVIFDKQKGSIIGQTNDGDLLVQVQGSTTKTAPSNVKVIGAKIETIKPPFKFSKETQKLLFEQYVRCGVFNGNIPVKTTHCYVRYSDWKEANDIDPINVVVEGQLSLLPKNQVRIFEDINNFANLDNYIPGVVIDENTGEVIENVQLNAVDYTEALGDADPVRVIRGGEGNEPGADSLPKAVLRVAEI